MLPRRLFDHTPCLDCIRLQTEVDDMHEALDQLTNRITLLTLQMTAMKHELFGQGSITRLYANGDLPHNR